MLYNQFDITPSAEEIWMCDSAGGLNHFDMREQMDFKRRYEICEDDRASGRKVGGVSINRE